MAPKSKATTAKRQSSQPVEGVNVQRILALVWHALSLSILTYALRRLPVHADISGFNIEEQFGSHYQFLTVLGLWFSRLTSFFALLCDLTPQVHVLRRIRTVLLAISLPAEVLISILYWSLLFLSPSLLIPPRQVVDPNDPTQLIWETVRLPILDDLCFHAVPAFVLLIDYMAFEPPFPRHIRPALISAVSTIAYVSWAEVCNRQNGNYPYPLLSVLNDWQRVLLYAACTAIFMAVSTVATSIHKVIDGRLHRQWPALQPGQSHITSASAKKRA